jgi:hypothetical protein
MRQSEKLAPYEVGLRLDLYESNIWSLGKAVYGL